MSIHTRFIRNAIGVALLSVAAEGRSADIAYRTVDVEGVSVFYREAGDPRAPTVLLLHGVPSSTRMYDGLMRRLADRYHLIAPDYPGFGHSGAPSPQQFTYTFDHLAAVIGKFTDALQLQRYVLFMQDYGAPVGLRLAIARPDAVVGMVFQNGNVYADGLGPVWEKRKAYWADRAAHEAEVQAGHLSLDMTRSRHLGSDPDHQAYDPDLWTDEVAFLNRPGGAAIQSQLIYDYQTNLASYSAWQGWLRQRALPTLVLWGRYDQAFTVPGAWAFRKDLPDAEIHILDAGHFAMDTRLGEVEALTRSFLSRLPGSRP